MPYPTAPELLVATTATDALHHYNDEKCCITNQLLCYFFNTTSQVHTLPQPPTLADQNQALRENQPRPQILAKLSTAMYNRIELCTIVYL